MGFDSSYITQKISSEDHASEGWPVQEEMQVSVLVDEVRLNTADHGRELGCVGPKSKMARCSLLVVESAESVVMLSLPRQSTTTQQVLDARHGF